MSSSTQNCFAITSISNNKLVFYYKSSNCGATRMAIFLNNSLALLMRTKFISECNISLDECFNKGIRGAAKKVMNLNMNFV